MLLQYNSVLLVAVVSLMALEQSVVQGQQDFSTAVVPDPFRVGATILHDLKWMSVGQLGTTLTETQLGS